MPRIRTIKPEFWGDEKLAPMAAIDRLVFLGLLSFADDSGRVVDNIKGIDGFIFPETLDSSRDSLARLSDAGRILRYESPSGQALIQIVNWRKHQKIDHPSKYTLPGPPSNGSRKPREGLAKSSRHDLRPATSTSDLRPATSDQRPGVERNGDTPAVGETHGGDAAAAPPAPHAIALAELQPPALEFLAAFYADDAKRYADAGQQMLAAVNGGTDFRGQRVLAYSHERLNAKCLEVIRTGVRDRDKAIVVLLAKLGDTSDLSAPGVAAANAVELEAKRDEQDAAGDLERATAWLAEHPDVEASIDEQLPVATDPFAQFNRTIARRAMVLTAWRAAGAEEAAHV